jgi:hypothetical protein
MVATCEGEQLQKRVGEPAAKMARNSASRIFRLHSGNRHGAAIKTTIILFLTGLSCSANAQSSQEWTATLQLESGSSTHCQLGHRGKMSVQNNVLSWTPNGFSFVVWRVPLVSGGSADMIVPVYGPASSAGHAKVTVPAGVGPREIRTISQERGCRHRYVPDLPQ